MAEVKVISKKKKLIATFIIMLILVFLFNRAMYWTEFSTWKNKVLVAVISLAGVIVVPLFLTYVKSVSDYIDMFISNKIKQIKALKDNWEKVLLYTALFVVIIVAAVLLEKLILSRVYGGYSYLRMYFCMSTGILIFALVLCGKIAYKRVEVVFAVAALIMGLTYIMVSPRHLLVTWDDETHYLRSVSLADVFDNTKFNAEGSFYDSQPATYMYTQGDLTKEEFDAILSNVEYEYSQKYTNNRFTSEVGKEFVAYIPAAVGIIMGKALGLSFFQTFLFSKMVILCTYVMLMYFAIKKLKNGKILLAVIGLSTTTMFMASTMSYDYWVIGFTTLGYSFFISEIQDKDKKLEYRNIIMMNVCFLLGIAPKAIYFVIMFVLLFMPVNKFKDKKQRKIYYAIIIGTAIFLMMTFLLPMLINSPGTGDSRGGSDVNSTEQIKYILSNPLEYSDTLLNFLKDYLNLDYASEFISSMAYMGYGKGTAITLMLIAALMYIDRGEEKMRVPYVRAAYFFSAAVCVVLVATALYISFTAVGADYVAGCQPRYLLPILFPTAYFIGVDGISTKINKNVMTIAAIGIMTYIFMSNMWTTCF